MNYTMYSVHERKTNQLLSRGLTAADQEVIETFPPWSFTKWSLCLVGNKIFNCFSYSYMFYRAFPPLGWLLIYTDVICQLAL